MARMVPASRNLRTVNCESCMLAFDGAAKGNPGRCGAGAVLHADDGSIVVQMREGVGFATNNLVEYRALILGPRQALSREDINTFVFKETPNLFAARFRESGEPIIMLWPTCVKCSGSSRRDLCRLKSTMFQGNTIVRLMDQANRAVNLSDGEV